METYGRCEVEKIVSWCVKKWGKSKYNENVPRLRVYKSAGNTYNIKGEYISDKNIISVYVGAINSIDELCGVIIHEYFHYLLDPVEYDNIYFDMIKKGFNENTFYNKHPHEIICVFNQNKYKEKCFMECNFK